MLDDVVLVIGPPGVGKSTLINYLCDVEHTLEKNKTNGSYFLQPKPNQGVPAKVGHGVAQQTQTAQLIKGKNFSFIECPAINEKQEAYDDKGNNIYASLGVLPLIEKAKNVRAIIVIVDWSSLESNKYYSKSGSNLMIGLTHILNTLVKDPLFLTSSVPKQPPLLFAISKPPVPERGEYFDTTTLKSQVIARVAQIIEESQDVTYLKSILSFLNLMKSDNIFIIRGYHDNEQDQKDHRKKLLEYLEELQKNQCTIPFDQFSTGLKKEEIPFSFKTNQLFFEGSLIDQTDESQHQKSADNCYM